VAENNGKTPREKSMKKYAITAALMLGALTHPAWAEKPAAPEKSKVTIAVGGRATLPYLPITVATHKGFFKDAGLDVEFFDVAGGTRALQSVVGGGADVAAGGYQHTISLQAKGQYISCLGLLIQNIGVALIMRKDLAEKYSSPADLKGLKIGVTSVGSGTHQFVTHLLSSAGLTNNDIAAIGVGTGSVAVAALRSGKVDAMPMGEPIVTMMADEAKIVEEAISTKSAEKHFGGPVPIICIYAPETFAKENPRTAQALANGLVRALQWIQKASAEEIADSVPEGDLQGAGGRELFVRAVENAKEMYSPDGVIPDGGPERVLKMLREFDESVRNVNIDFSRTFTNEFVKAAVRAKQ